MTAVITQWFVVILSALVFHPVMTGRVLEYLMISGGCTYVYNM